MIDARTLGADRNAALEGIAYDSRAVKKNYLFIAVAGYASDGHDFIEKAIAGGASAVMHNRDAEIDAIKARHPAIAFIPVDDTRRAMADAAARFYGYPSASMNVVAVTGTNGKTTTAMLIKNIFEATGRKAGLLGTIHNLIGSEKIPSIHTTPESADLQAFLADMKARGANDLVMEASSHALYLHRCDALDFNSIIFTNITEDHLDFHLTMHAYLNAKLIAFDLLAASPKKDRAAILNVHTDRYDHIRSHIKNTPVVTYGLDERADYRADSVTSSFTGTRYRLMRRGSFVQDVSLSLTGDFNVLNSLAALAYADSAGIPLDRAIDAIARVQVPGRFEIVTDERHSFAVIVDYAHTDDALKNVLTTIRRLNPARIITVFGCGGDRDRKKRPLMGKAVGELSDEAIVTLDNPRTETIDQIISDIRPGIDAAGKRYEVIIDRREAISKAIASARERDVVLIAGKGHEDYQIFKDKTVHFDDREVAREALSKR